MPVAERELDLLRLIRPPRLRAFTVVALVVLKLWSGHREAVLGAPAVEA